MDKIELLAERDLLKEKINQLEKEKAELTEGYNQIGELFKRAEKEKAELKENIIAAEKTYIIERNQLLNEIKDLKQQLEGLTPEMIQGFKDLIKTKVLCSVCAQKNNEDCHGDWCVNADDECIDMRDFEFFNDSEGENEY